MGMIDGLAMTRMKTTHADFGHDGLVIVAVNVHDELAKANRMLTDLQTRSRIALDRDTSYTRGYEVVAMPKSFLIGRDGRVVEEHLGFRVLELEKYEAAVSDASELTRKS